MGAENEDGWRVRHEPGIIRADGPSLKRSHSAHRCARCSATIPRHTRCGRALTSPLVPLAFADVAVPNKAFKRVVRDLEFDVAELALMTFLMARSRGVPLRLLPVVVFSRNPLPHLVCDAERRRITPDDLRAAASASAPTRRRPRSGSGAARRSVRRRASTRWNGSRSRKGTWPACRIHRRSIASPSDRDLMTMLRDGTSMRPSSIPFRRDRDSSRSCRIRRRRSRVAAAYAARTSTT